MNSATAEPTGPGDVAAIAAIEQRGADAPWTETQIRGSLALATTLAHLVRAPDGQVVAHVIAAAVPPEGEVHALTVLPEWRRRGLGRVLLEQVHTRWREAAVEEAFLEVRRDNVAARALYERLGWAAISTRPAYYEDGVDAVVMRWRG